MIDREGYPTVSDYASKVLTKLADYEDAEEQGLLLRLPCKVGTIIYKIENNTDACCKCNDFKISYCDDDLCSNKNGHDEGGVFYVLNPQYADKPLCKKQNYHCYFESYFVGIRAFGRCILFNPKWKDY